MARRRGRFGDKPVLPTRSVEDVSLMQILVTGSSGFIGRHLLAALASRGDEVVALGRANAVRTVPAPYELVLATDWTAQGLARALDGRDFDAVIHLAAYGVRSDDRNIEQMRDVNVLLPSSIVDLASTRDAVVVAAGSNAEYAAGESANIFAEDAPLESRKLYGASKAAGGLMAGASAHYRGVSFVHLRYFNVYGPGEAAYRLLPSVYRALANGERPHLSLGMQVRDFVYVGDVIEATIGAMEALRRSPPPRVAFNVCTGEGSTVADVARSLCQQMEADVHSLGFGDKPMRPDDVPRLVGDPSALTSWTGWRAKTKLNDGIAHTLAWLRKDNSE